MVVIGEIQETFRNESVVRFEWRVPNTSALRNTQPPYYYHSPDLGVLSMRWNLKLFEHEKAFLGLYVVRNNSIRALRIAVGLRWNDENECILERDRRLNGLTFSVKFLRRMSRPHLDTLTCSVTLWDYPTSVEGGKFATRSTQTEDQAAGSEVANDVCTLQKHLQDLLLTGDDQDFTIKVGNREFRAHKCMLRARSPVFSAMFKHKMKESEDGSISIDDCDSDAFGEFLKYVYTGKIEDLSPSKAVGLYYVADKYDFSGLKEICVKLLKGSLSTTVICDVIALATDHGENDLLECAMTFFTKNVTQILTTVEWQRFGKNNFVAANELCIRAFESLEKK